MPKKKLTQERLKELLIYDPDTGIFVNKINRSKRALAGNETGHIDIHGYVLIVIDYKIYRAHRLAWLYVEGYLPDTDIDHINRIKIDNRRCNLRVVLHVENTRNCKMSIKNSSGITGVSQLSKNKWKAYISDGHGQIDLGTYRTKTEAVMERVKAEVEYNYRPFNKTSSAYNYIVEKEYIDNIYNL